MKSKKLPLAFLAIAITVPALVKLITHETKEHTEEYDMAAETGARHGAEVASLLADGDSLGAQNLLIEIGSREAQLRRHGVAKVADRYHKAFITTLDSLNPSLAAEINALATE